MLTARLVSIVQFLDMLALWFLLSLSPMLGKVAASF